VVAGIGLGGIVFNLILTRLQDAMTRAAIMRVGSFIIFAAMAGVALSPTWQLEMAAFTAVGLGFYMLHTGIQTEATELAPGARGSAVALHAFSLFFGMALGPVIYGAAIPLIGAPTAVLIGGALVMVAGLLIARRVVVR
jgi:predicted MFS family arabinose efflux permease